MKYATKKKLLTFAADTFAASIIAAVICMLFLLATGGCSPVAGQPAPTTQQVLAGESFALHIEQSLFIILENNGVIKSANEADANAIQSAVTAAQTQYAADINAGFAEADALADALSIGLLSYEQNVPPPPAPTPAKKSATTKPVNS